MNLQLIPLFNAGYDFARLDRLTGRYVGCTVKKKATHRLHCTRWNPNLKCIPNVKKRLREERTRPAGWALSVCATPLRRKQDRKPGIRLKRPILPADQRLVYKRSGTLEGKRAVLIAMTKTHAHPTKMRKLIKTLGNAKCDTMYRTLRIANKVARRRAARAARRLLRKQGKL